MNTATDSAELLRDYAATGAEASFAELVRRHVDLVYSAALRRGAGDATLANEVAQTVFTDLARKARSPHRAEAEAVLAAASLAGWLYHHTGFVTATAVRGEVRRRDREKTAMLLHAQTDATDWSRVAPVLEDAMAELPDRDRDALVLRFFEKESFARVGAMLGTGEDAARMRVDRALDRLRESLAKRGVTSTAAALASSLTAFGVAPAPAGLAATITAAAAAVALPVAGGVASVVASKPVAAGVAALLAVAALLTAGYLTQDARARLAAAERDRQALSTELARLQAERDAARPISVSPDELARLRQEHTELLRLRGEVARLRRGLEEAAPARGTVTNSPAVVAETNASPAEVRFNGRLIGVPDAALNSLGLTIPLNGSEVLSELQADVLLQRLENQEGVDVLSVALVSTWSGRQAQLSVGGPGDGPPRISAGESLTLEVLPTVPRGSRQIELTMSVGSLSLPGPEERGRIPLTRAPSRTGGPMQSVHAFVWDGQSVLLRQAAQPSPEYAAIRTEPRSLLVLVELTLHDATGQRLFPPDGTGPATTEPPAVPQGNPGEHNPAP